MPYALGWLTKMRLGRDLEPIWPHNLYTLSHARSHLQSPPASSLLPVGIVRREAGTVSLVKKHVFLGGWCWCWLPAEEAYPGSSSDSDLKSYFFSQSDLCSNTTHHLVSIISNLQFLTWSWHMLKPETDSLCFLLEKLVFPPYGKRANVWHFLFYPKFNHSFTNKHLSSTWSIYGWWCGHKLDKPPAHVEFTF